MAITDINGNVTDRFEYDTYGNLTSRTGNTDTIFMYNGRDGVVTDSNGLIYMRARYYAPELRRFINADILAGDIANGITLNRYAYANANPVSLIDPRGLSADERYPQKSYEERKEDFLKYLLFNFDSFLRIDATEMFELMTAYGIIEGAINFAIGASQDENGYYYISQDYWQSTEWVGYNSVYDLVFEFGTNIAGEDDPYYDSTEFTVGDTTYVLWWWKADYINLGAGAELGIYEKSNLPGHVLTSTDNNLKMSLTLEDTKNKQTIFHFTPDEYQWWINHFDPFTQGMQTEDMRVTATIDFSDNQHLYEAFAATHNGQDSNWTFDLDNKTATLVY